MTAYMVTESRKSYDVLNISIPGRNTFLVYNFMKNSIFQSLRMFATLVILICFIRKQYDLVIL